jgi:rhodanese-related sulfurtransferase
MSLAQLVEEARKGTIILIDVRPRPEFEHSHLPYVRLMPLDEIEYRIRELSKPKEIMAYCRGLFCMLAGEAAHLLWANHRKVSKLFDVVAEWHAAGLRLESGKVQ